MGKVNISQVAKVANVSKATVSYYLNGNFEKMSLATRKKLDKVVHDLGYIPSLGAQSLSRRRKSMTIGVVLEQTYVFSSYSMDFFMNMVKYLGSVTIGAGYKMVIIPDSESGSEDVVEYVLSMAGLVDGFFLFNLQEKDVYIKAFKARKIPFVCFGYPFDETVNNYIATDQGKGIKMGVEWFFSQGVDGVVISLSHAAQVVSRQYYDGYLDAHKQLGRQIDDDFVIRKIKPESDDLKNAFVKIFAKGSKKIGFIISYRQLAVLTSVADELGKCLGKDFAVILLDYFPDFGSDQKYARIVCPMEELGTTGAKMLLRAIEENDIRKLEPKLFDPEFIKGDSCFFGE